MTSTRNYDAHTTAIDEKWNRNEHGGRIRANHPSRHDLQAIPIGENARLDVFWKHLDIGLGPAFSVVINDEEILRVDCFGPDDGHMHVAFFMPEKGTNRLYFPENTRSEQIDRGLFEINRNLRYYLDRMVDPDIRAFEPDAERLASATMEAREILKAFLDRVETPDSTPAVSRPSG